jgi:hypothetical protein
MGRPTTRRWFTACGTILIIVGAIMMQVAVATFVATERPGALLTAIAGISFFTWWIPLLLGVVLLAADRFRRPD